MTASCDHVVRFDPGAQGPLHGLRVVDVSRLVAGNMLSVQLADFGADVIKVESPAGDPLRDWLDGEQPTHWKAYGRNKRSIVLDLRDAEGMEALRRLLSTADVFIENYRPGTLERMGLAPSVLEALNPGLVTVRISGFGQTGPYATLPGFGTLVEGMSGFAAKNGFADREPVLPPLALADMIAGLTGVGAVMTALYARERGRSRGQVIDLSLLEPIFATLGPQVATMRATGKVDERCGSASSATAPRNAYRCADGKYVALSGSIQTIAFRIFDVIGRPDMKDDPRFDSNTARLLNREALDEIIGAWFARHGRDAALELMRGSGATVGPIYDAADIAVDPHFAGRGVFVEVEEPSGSRYPIHNIFPRLSATAGVWRYPAPAKGEHTADILQEIGMRPPGTSTEAAP